MRSVLLLRSTRSLVVASFVLLAMYTPGVVQPVIAQVSQQRSQKPRPAGQEVTRQGEGALPVYHEGTDAGLDSLSQASKRALQADGAAEITVLSPNGGETFAVGEEITIDWTSQGVYGDFHIEIYRRGDVQEQGLYRINGGGPARWTIPSRTGPGDYYIKIYSFDDPDVYDTSDRYFAIVPGVGPEIVVTQPDSGGRWAYGDEMTIAWESQQVTGSVEIELYRGIAEDKKQLTYRAANDGSYTWSIPASIEPSDDYYIVVQSADNYSVWGGGPGRFTVGYPKDSLHAELVETSNTRGEAWDVDVVGSYAYIADHEGLSIINIADPNRPEEFGYLPLPGAEIRDVDVAGDYAYVAYHPEGVGVIDVSDPSRPELRKVFRTSGEAYGVVVEGNYAYVADDRSGLLVLDVSQPTEPVLVATVNTPGKAIDVEVAGSYAYVADYNRGLRIIDISDPIRPQEAGAYGELDYAWDVAVVGDYAYVADGRYGLRIVDVSVPSSAYEVSYFDTEGNTYDVAVAGDYAYLADDDKGVRIVDVSDPERPGEVGYYRTPDRTYGIAASGNLAYAASKTGGLHIVRNLLAPDEAPPEASAGWPTVSGAAIVLKVVAPIKLGLTRVEAKISSDLSLPFQMVDSRSLDGIEAESFFYLRESDLSGLEEAISELRLIGRNPSNGKERQLGHVAFVYTRDDQSTDAILYVHTGREVRPRESTPDWEYNPEWKYYGESLYPVSMLIPPGEDFASVEEEREPVLLVHGVSGYYPYWGENLVAELNKVYDTWQFYYPYDQQIEKSGRLLAHALDQLTSSKGLVDYESPIDIVTHSMGGLVARYFIQSDEEAVDKIDKFLMLGTPNHGSYASFKLVFANFQGRVTEWWGGKDRKAPAYRQMIPGSEFMYKLNDRRHKTLYEDDQQYLVVAGTKDNPVVVKHDEINKQDDGVVAVSSASLLNYGVPLATVHTDHGGLKAATETIRSFLRNDYTPAIKSLGGEVTGFWSDLHTSPNAGFNQDTGILTFRIPDSKVDQFELTRSEHESSIIKFKNRIVIKSGLVRVPRTNSNYFYINRRLINDLGFPAGNKYTISLCKIPDSYQSTAGSTPHIREDLYRCYSTRPDFIKVEPLQTTMATLDLTAGELTITNSTSSITPVVAAGKSKPLAEYQYLIDAAVDSVVFWLTASDGAGFENHDMRLTSPSGTEYTPALANDTPGMESKQGTNSAFAFFYVQDPKPGTWTVQYNADLDQAVLSAPVISEINLAISFPDSAFVVGNTVELDIAGQSLCTDSQVTATLAHAEDDEGPFESVGDLGLAANASAGYRGAFTADEAGIYVVSIDLACTHQGEEVRRQAVAAIGVTDPSTATDVERDEREVPSAFALEQNYPNPFNPTTTISYSIKEPAYVELLVYDLLGRKIAVLVDVQQTSGHYEVTFDASGLASGVYLYTLRAGDFTQTRRLVLLK